MKPPTIKSLLQELIVQLWKLNGGERLKEMERRIEKLTGNLEETNKRHEALVKYLKVGFVYQKESYKKIKK